MAILPAWSVSEQLETLNQIIDEGSGFSGEDLDENLRKPDLAAAKSFALKCGAGAAVALAVIIVGLLVFIPPQPGKQPPVSKPVAVTIALVVCGLVGLVTYIVMVMIAKHRERVEQAIKEGVDSLGLKFHEALYMRSINFPVLYSEIGDSVSAEPRSRRIMFTGTIEDTPVVGMKDRQCISMTMGNSYNAVGKFVASQSEGNVQVRYPLVVVFPNTVENLADSVVLRRDEPDCGYFRMSVSKDSATIGLSNQLEKQLWVSSEVSSQTKQALSGKYARLMTDKKNTRKWHVQTMGGRVAVWSPATPSSTNAKDAADYIKTCFEIYQDFLKVAKETKTISDTSNPFSFGDS